MVFRVFAVDECFYVPCTFQINMAHSWSQEVVDLSGKLMSHDLATAVNTVGRKLAFTRSSLPTASMMA
jgi:hypothetical protein